jgi:branched-chain amino acid aminotransferase
VSATVVVDGELVHSARALSALDRGALLGDAAFEVLRVYAGVPFLLGDHLARLTQSLEILGFEDAPARASLEKDVARVLEASRLRDAYLRIAITRGEGLGLSIPTTRCTRVVIAAPLVLPAKEAYTHGVAATVVASPFEAGALRARGAKTTSYLEHVLATKEAKAATAFEAILMAPTGQILEGASSNVFMVQGGTLLTPPASTGILAGITRAEVLRAARDLGIEARESLVTLTPLRRADELFLTSSIRELVPITKLDKNTLGPPGPVYKALHDRYRARVEAAVSEANPSADVTLPDQ